MNNTSFKSDNRINIFNILVLVYNFISVLVNRTNGYISYSSIILVIFNLFITIMAIKNNRNQKSEKICLVFEILTVVLILTAL